MIEPTTHQVVIVGAGFAGIAASVRLAEQGVSHVVIERAEDVGGTWRDNDYPGCRCDVPSHLYSLSFAPNPGWSHTYSRQAEIHSYLQRVARERGVLERVRLGTELHKATWDPAEARWDLQTSAGPLRTQVLVLGNGPLAEPALPDLPGMDDFPGHVFHSARWNHDADLADKRVAVIGTGASAIQFVPRLQRSVRQLTIFQRTPPWILPHRSRPITDRERRMYGRLPITQRLARLWVYALRELIAVPILRGGRTVDVIERQARRHLERQVVDPELREKLLPEYRAGCKRILFSNGWYPALASDNVDVVVDKVVRVDREGVITADGSVHQADVVIFGTGFRTTDNPIAHRIVGREGHTMADCFLPGGTRAYGGTAIPGFPNLFLLAGPNTGIGHTSLILMIEAQVSHLASCLDLMRRRDLSVLEVTEEAFSRWNEEIDKKLVRTVWNAGGCTSWYLDATGRNTMMWPDFTWRFTRRMKKVDPDAFTQELARSVPPLT